MIDISTKSLFFVILIIIAPFLLRNGSKWRKYIFLILNSLIIILTASSVTQFIVTVLWILIPFGVARIFGRAGKCKSLIIVLLVFVYAYLAKYDLIFSTLHINYIFAFRILGLSYFLFREIDYIVQYDYLKEQNHRLGLIDYINYVTNFYTLMAGPILRYKEFTDDFYKYDGSEGMIPLSKDDLLKQLDRVVNGYFKVYVISAVFNYYAKYWYDGLGGHSGLLKEVLAFVIFAYLNCWFIYFNFSGYCDIVIGAAALSGMTIHENFNKPYMSKSVVEFWNRHHITLSEWIRDYIFTPLYKWFLSVPFKKKILFSQVLALFITFLAAGIWHGTTLDYLMYGIFQGLGIVVATLWKSKRKKWLGKARNKKYENSMVVITITRIVTWMYISLTFSFTGYEIVKLFVK